MVCRFYWNCNICGRSYLWREWHKGLLCPLPIPDRFYSKLLIDFIIDLPIKNKGDLWFIMVITNRLLKSITIEAITIMSAEACAECFVQCHYRYHGFPRFLTSDRGSNWVGDF